MLKVYHVSSFPHHQHHYQLHWKFVDHPMKTFIIISIRVGRKNRHIIYIAKYQQCISPRNFISITILTEVIKKNKYFLLKKYVIVYDKKSIIYNDNRKTQ